jgi:hypothetical protein
MPNQEPTSEEITRQAVTERNKSIAHTEPEVDLALKMLAFNGGNAHLTAKQLKEEGLDITRYKLEGWRERSFPRRYHQIRNELGKEVGEDMAGRAFERALQADEASRLYLNEAIKRLPDLAPEDIAKAIQAFSNAMKNNVEKAQTLRGEPNVIEASRDINDEIRELERLGVGKRVEAIDVEVEEIDEDNQA